MENTHTYTNRKSPFDVRSWKFAIIFWQTETLKSGLLAGFPAAVLVIGSGYLSACFCGILALECIQSSFKSLFQLWPEWAAWREHVCGISPKPAVKCLQHLSWLVPASAFTLHLQSYKTHEMILHCCLCSRILFLFLPDSIVLTLQDSRNFPKLPCWCHSIPHTTNSEKASQLISWWSHGAPGRV